MSLEFRIASSNDAEEIASLVNRAYRPVGTAGGWTHEGALLSGDRISIEQVRSLFIDNSVVLLLCTGAKIVACVHVERDQGSAYIGMLTTEPAQQSNGYGKLMLGHAEAYAAGEYGVSHFNMSVLSHRPELLAYYERRGYQLTGEQMEFPLDANVGQPVVAGMKLLSLRKRSAAT